MKKDNFNTAMSSTNRAYPKKSEAVIPHHPKKKLEAFSDAFKLISNDVVNETKGPEINALKKISMRHVKIRDLTEQLVKRPLQQQNTFYGTLHAQKRYARCF
jgi:hypothetical protein